MYEEDPAMDEDMADPDALEGEEAAGEEDEPEMDAEGDGEAEEEEPGEDVAADEDGSDENMIEASKDGKFCVRLRQGLKTAESVDKFVSQLREHVEQKQAAGETLVFDDIDICQNRLTTEQFDAIFSAFTEGDVHVEQLRSFGCPTLDDDAAEIIANWLSGVTSENTPYEIHLSDCAITAVGYEKIMTAFQENDAFPADDRRNPERGKLGVYLRLEQNYIDTNVMQQSIKDGVVAKFRKNAPPKHSDTLKVRLLVREDGSLQQRKGDPPAPEDVPEPRPWRKGKGKGKDKGSSKGSSRGDRARDRSRGKGDSSKGKGKRTSNKDEKPPWLALAPAKTASSPVGARRVIYSEARDTRRPSEPASKGGARGSSATSTTSKGRGKDNGSSSGKNGSSSNAAPRSRGAAAPFSAFGQNSRQNNASRDRSPLKRAAPSTLEAAKRPRTGPMSSDRGFASRGGDRGNAAGPSRTLSSGRGTAAGGKGGSRPGGQPSLRGPWEQHFSEQYKLHYYWNSKTGESSWEKPRDA